MENKIFDILVNFEATDSITSNPIKIFQGDYNSITFNFTLSKNDYASAVLYMVKPSGAHYVQELENSQVAFEDSSAFDEAGTYIYRIALYDADSRLTNTANGKLTVVANDLPSDDEVVAEANYLILDQLINQTIEIQTRYSDMDDKIDEFNDNADAKLSAFNANYETKINNVNSSILEYEEETYYAPYADAKRLENHIANHFALTPDENTYGVDFPLWSTSQSSAGTKTDANVGLVCTPGTDTVKTIDTYPVAWDTYDVNAVVDNNGVRHITGIKGVANYHDVGKYDCFVLKRTYWQKIWTENGYLKIRRRFVPTEGYDICPLAINKDGTWNPWFVVPKYFAGDIDGKLYGSKNLLPAHSLTINASEHASDEEYSDNISYSGLITLGHARGNYYSAGLLAEWYDTLTTFYLKFATRNTQSIMAGNTSNDRQYQVTQVTANSNKVVISTANANNIDLYSCVSVGDPESATNYDRQHAYMHNIVYDARVIGKEVVDANNTALILDHANFTTTATCRVSTMHERSGFSDLVLGRTGSPISNTNGRHGFVFDGVEHAVGGYEVMGNAFMDIIDSAFTREIYYTNDSTKLTSTVATAKANYKKSDLSIHTTGNGWKYITEYGFDTKDGLAVPTNAGQSGSGSSTGYADGYNVDTGTSGQREFLAFGYLNNGATAGLSYLGANAGLSAAGWNILARLSVNGVGGELAE